MATRITNAAVLAACEEMLTESIAYDEMDCQAAVEEAYRRAGKPLKETDLAGSNSHFRACIWTGAPERACELLGVKTVPVGTETYIVEDDGEEPAKYRSDNRGNASHMGIYMGSGRTFNSSEKMGGVVVSEKFNGRTEAVSGSWNMVGFKPYVNYGFSDEQLVVLRGDANYTGSDSTYDEDEEASGDIGSEASVDTTDFYMVKRGCKGGAVERLQTWLNDLGYTLVVDHDFGPTTDAAVRKFQSDKGLEADGIVGQKTWAALAEARQAAMANA